MKVEDFIPKPEPTEPKKVMTEEEINSDPAFAELQSMPIGSFLSLTQGRTLEEFTDLFPMMEDGKRAVPTNMLKEIAVTALTDVLFIYLDNDDVNQEEVEALLDAFDDFVVKLESNAPDMGDAMTKAIELYTQMKTKYAKPN